MPSSDVVKKMVDDTIALLEEKGWTQKDFVHPSKGCLCLSGALRVVAGQDYVAYNRYGYIMVPSRGDNLTPEMMSAYRFIRDTLVYHFLGESIAYWNDVPGRTFEEVKQALLGVKEFV